MTALLNIALAISAFAGMEVAAWAIHRWVMHGSGWSWHESHHRPRTGRFERNDRFVLIFSLIAMALFALGQVVPFATAIAIGVTAYGIAYFLLHEVLVHRRLPPPVTPRSGSYLAHLVAAHHLHHAVHTREGAVSFGFLYAPSLSRLRAQLRGVNRPPAPRG